MALLDAFLEATVRRLGDGTLTPTGFSKGALKTWLGKALDLTQTLDLTGGVSGATSIAPRDLLSVDLSAIQFGGTNTLWSTLKAVKPVRSGQRMIVSGYYAAGDGGGGIFEWDATLSSADNAVDIINPTGNAGNGRWRRVYTGPISVRWAGARGSVFTVSGLAMTAGSNAVSFSSNSNIQTGMMIYIVGAGAAVEGVSLDAVGLAGYLQKTNNTSGFITSDAAGTVPLNAGATVSGAAGLAGYDDTAAFQACATLLNGTTRIKTLYVPAGTYFLASKLTMPTNTSLIGDGWQSTSIRACHTGDGVEIGSGCIVRDLGVHGCLAAAKGISAPALVNRIELIAVRTEGCNGAGVFLGRVQNSSLIDVFSQLNVHNFRIEEAENCFLLNSNGSHRTSPDVPAHYRNFYITTARNLDVVKGIFERGTSAAYCVEITGTGSVLTTATGISFRWCELFAGGSGTIAVKWPATGNGFTLDHSKFALGSAGLAADSAGAPYNVVGLQPISGLNGRHPCLVFRGNVHFNQSRAVPLVTHNFLAGDEGWLASGTGGTRTWNASTRKLDIVGTSVTSGARVAPHSSTDYTMVTDRWVRLRFVIDSASTDATLTALGVAPGADLVLGTFGVGHHEKAYKWAENSLQWKFGLNGTMSLASFEAALL